VQSFFKFLRDLIFRQSGLRGVMSFNRAGGGGYGGLGGGGGSYQGQGEGLGRFFVGTPVTKWLIISNLVLFLVTMLLPGGAGHSIIDVFGKFNMEQGIYGGQIWRFLTFQFLHADFGHVLFNMIGIFFFGRIMERWWGSREFLVFYLLCGVAGALFFAALVWMPGFLPMDVVGTYLLGASAGVFGVLIGVAILNPEGIVYLMMVLPMKMRTFAIAYLAYEIYIVLTNGENAGGSAGHLGGVIAGVALVKGHVWFRNLVSRGVDVFVKKDEEGIRKSREGQTNFESKLKPRRKGPLNVGDAEVDRILDKISAEGMQSLTEKEKEVLHKKADQ